jgi:hypothetical protein
MAQLRAFRFVSVPLPGIQMPRIFGRITSLSVLVPFRSRLTSPPEPELQPHQQIKIPSRPPARRTSLKGMPQTVPGNSADNFAGFLASLAAPSKPSPSVWDDGLADDIATITYEQALRPHLRNQPPAAAPPPAAAEIEPTHMAPPSGPGCSPVQPSTERLKTASITIRLSDAECAQLRQRAAEAGLTVSAYLRSCTLEVESLRAQVKEALAQIRQSGTNPPTSAATTPSGTTASGIWRRLWPFGSSSGFGKTRLPDVL